MLMCPVGLGGGSCPISTRYRAMYDFNCKIELFRNSEEIRSNTDILRGKISFYSAKVLQNLWIELEGWAVSSFQTKVDGHFTNHFKEYQFLTGSSFHFIQNGQETKKEFAKSTNGKPQDLSYPFSIDLSGLTSYPSSMRNSHGEIKYMLVVYGNLTEGKKYVLEDKRLRKVNGHLDYATELLENPKLDQPLTVTREKSKFSLFSKKKQFMKAHLSLRKRGFAVGETLHFHLHVENFLNENVQRMTTALVHKTIYFAGAMTKTTTAVLGQLETLECTQIGVEVNWTEKFKLPLNLMPTFTRERKSVEVLYFIHFTVEMTAGHTLKGEVPILICTRTTPWTDNNINDDRVINSDTATWTRRDSNNWDTISIQTCASLPRYSALSSRRSSYETLPPAYEEVSGMLENWEEEEGSSQ